jgi:hypothetical protein
LVDDGFCLTAATACHRFLSITTLCGVMSSIPLIRIDIFDFPKLELNVNVNVNVHPCEVNRLA